MNEVNPFKLDINEVRSVEVKFNNGESIFIPCKKLRKLDINLISVVDVIDDSIFKYGFLFNLGSIIIDKLFLQQMLGDGIYDKFMYRNGINSLILEYNNDYKIKSNIPLILCLAEVKSTPDYTTKMKYEEDGDNFIISWFPIGTL